MGTLRVNEIRDNTPPAAGLRRRHWGNTIEVAEFEYGDEFEDFVDVKIESYGNQFGRVESFGRLMTNLKNLSEGGGARRKRATRSG